jgi:hypothetical protein
VSSEMLSISAETPRMDDCTSARSESSKRLCKMSAAPLAYRTQMAFDFRLKNRGSESSPSPSPSLPSSSLIT